MVIASGFVVWAAAFIYRSSFISIDSKRWFCLFDDAMISMRYAWNLAHGSGLVWNVGERVEGYSNLLMTLVMSIAAGIFGLRFAVLAVQCTGVVVMLGIAYLTTRFADQLAKDRNDEFRARLRALAFFCALGYYPLAYWSLMGMETGLLTLLILFALVNALRFGNEGHLSNACLMGLGLGLAYLTRADSMIVSAALLPLAAFGGGNRLSVKSRVIATFAAACILFAFVLASGIWRWDYYGTLVPNTFALRLAGMPFAFRVQNGLGFIKPFVVVTAPAFLVVIVGSVWKPSRWKVLVLLIMSGLICYQVCVGGDPWDYWRMISPAIPIAFTLVGYEFLGLAEYLFGRSRSLQELSQRKRGTAFAAVAIMPTVALLVTTDLPFAREIGLVRRPYMVGKNHQKVDIALALDAVTTNEATVGVTWAGAIPYFTKRRSIDFLGRCDVRIANTAPDLSGKWGALGMMIVPGHNKYDLNYSIRQLRPTYVQTLVWCGDDLTDYGRSTYTEASYRGVKLLLRRGSGAVLWDRCEVRPAVP